MAARLPRQMPIPNRRSPSSGFWPTRKTRKSGKTRGSIPLDFLFPNSACKTIHDQGETYMIGRRQLLEATTSGLAASVAMPFVGRSGFAATPTHTLKLTFADTQSHPLYEVLKRFADDVQKRTSGAIEIQVFSIGQLGSGTNILTGLQTGIIDLCAHTPGFIDAFFPKFRLSTCPSCFRTPLPPSGF